jgi:phosphoribosylformylglycinamidine cyclo-ligase
MITYKTAGVNLAEADLAKSKIGHWVKTTFNSQVLGQWGQFGGCFEPDFSKFKHPVLVSSTDGVGTKLKVAIEVGIHDTVGQDLVNHCVNDILTCGALPLFFLDYLAMGVLDSAVVEQVVKGVAVACKQNDCALIGGETAEMPGVYQKHDYDLAGTIVGVVERDKLIDGSKLVPGDILIGFPSNGLHTNGYSLVRKVLLSEGKFHLNDNVPELNVTFPHNREEDIATPPLVPPRIAGRKLSLGEELLKIHRSYLSIIQEIISRFPIKGMAHITGSGLEGNVKRIVPKGMKAEFDWSAWQVPAIFSFIQKHGNIDIEEMRRVFNLGIGFVIGCENKYAEQVLEFAKTKGENPLIIGKIVATVE